MRPVLSRVARVAPLEEWKGKERKKEKRMTNPMITLGEGPNRTELLILEGPLALVLGGTVHLAGDVVRLPGMMTWEEAALKGAREDTALSPFDLELVYDVVTGAHLSSLGLEEIMETQEKIQELSGGGEDWNPLDVDEDLARAVGDLLAEEPARRPAGQEPEKRKTSQAG
jgi:hypothetical protein